MTIGHSLHPLQAFLAWLRAHGVEVLVDVRRNPYSRRAPQFNREPLAKSLIDAGIGYLHLEALGGMREALEGAAQLALPDPRLLGYAHHMDTAEFRDGLERLMGVAAERQAVILCAESSPARCHRSMIADALVARGVAVEHIVGEHRREPHRLPAGVRIEDGRVHYLGTQTQLDLEPE